jgi:hypothetical protein
MVLQDRKTGEKLTDKDMEGSGFDIISCMNKVFAMMYCVKRQNTCQDKSIGANS